MESLLGVGKTKIHFSAHNAIIEDIAWVVMLEDMRNRYEMNDKMPIYDGKINRDEEVAVYDSPLEFVTILISVIKYEMRSYRCLRENFEDLLTNNVKAGLDQGD